MQETETIRMSDPKQFDRFFHENYQKLCYYATLLVGDDAAAEDVVQEVFISLMQNDVAYLSAAHASRALYVSVRNRCIDHLRSRRVAPHSSLDTAEGISAGDDIDQMMVRAEVLALVEQSISRLPRSQREVFRMAYVDGMNNQEIADTLGISVNTVKVDKQRAKTKLRSWLGEAFPLALLLLGLYD